MIEKIKRPVWMAASILLLNLTTFLIAQDFSVDFDRMQRDLRIMEGILNKLLKSGSDRGIHSGGETKGVYLEDFGIVFQTQDHAPLMVIQNLAETYRTHASEEAIKKYEEEINAAHAESEEEKEKVKQLEMELQEQVEAKDEMKQMQKEFQEQVEMMREQQEEMKRTLPRPERLRDVILTERYGKADEEERAKTIENLKKNIRTFMKSYAPAIGQLRPQDRIAILVKFDELGWRESNNGFLTGWTLKNDLDRFRSMQLSEKDFDEHIKFQYGDSNAEIDTDINIMTEIIDRALENTSMPVSVSNHGLYLDGLGALFFMSIPNVYWMSPGNGHIEIISEDIRNAIAYSSRGTRDKKTEKSDQKDWEKIHKDRTDQIQNELIDILASYGHTLRLKSGERVVLDVNLGEQVMLFQTGKRLPSRFILQIGKKDLDDYNLGTLTLPNLRNKIIMKTF